MGLGFGSRVRVACRKGLIMIRIFEINLPVEHSSEDLHRAIAHALRVPPRDLLSWEIYRQAIDARTKTNIRLIYTVDATVRREKQLLEEGHDHRIIPTPDESYMAAEPGLEPLPHRPVIVGSGPAGLLPG